MALRTKKTGEEGKAAKRRADMFAWQQTPTNVFPYDNRRRPLTHLINLGTVVSTVVQTSLLLVSQTWDQRSGERKDKGGNAVERGRHTFNIWLNVWLSFIKKIMQKAISHGNTTCSSHRVKKMCISWLRMTALSNSCWKTTNSFLYFSKMWFIGSHLCYSAEVERVFFFYQSKSGNSIVRKY